MGVPSVEPVSEGVGHARLGRPDRRHSLAVATSRTCIELSRMTGLNACDVLYILEELSDVMLRQFLRGEPAGLPNLGILYIDPPIVKKDKTKQKPKHRAKFRIWKRVIDHVAENGAKGGRYKQQMAKIRDNSVVRNVPVRKTTKQGIEDTLREYSYLRKPKKKIL